MTTTKISDHKDFLASLSAGDRARLTTTSNLSGLWHLIRYIMALGFLGTYIALKAPYWPVMMPIYGIMLAFLFTLQHECTHNTPFRSTWLNFVIGQITGVILCQPFLWFRYFHMAHHRHTNIAGKDPELAGGAKPDNWPRFLWHLSTISYWRDKIAVLAGNIWRHHHPDYVPKSAYRALRFEAFIMIGLYSCAGVFVIYGHDWLIRLWLLPLLIGFPVLRLYLLAEHGRCAMVANMFENTRTIYSSKIICFLSWNMPYHTEHHILPAVPFQKLPDLNKRTSDYLAVTCDGYGDFTTDYIRHFDDAR